jgi:hypothetical protein
MPLYPSKVLRARERAPTPYSSTIFYLGLTFGVPQGVRNTSLAIIFLNVKAETLCNSNLLFFPELHNTLNILWTATSFNCMYPLMHVHTFHRPYGYPLFTLCPWQQMH